MKTKLFGGLTFIFLLESLTLFIKVRQQFVALLAVEFIQARQKVMNYKCVSSSLARLTRKHGYCCYILQEWHNKVNIHNNNGIKPNILL